MDFEQYKKDITEALGTWLNTLNNGNRQAAEEMKESTGDLISGFKESFPRRKEEIQTIVDDIQEKFWRDNEKKDGE